MSFSANLPCHPNTQVGTKQGQPLLQGGEHQVRTHTARGLCCRPHHLGALTGSLSALPVRSPLLQGGEHRVRPHTARGPNSRPHHLGALTGSLSARAVRSRLCSGFRTCRLLWMQVLCRSKNKLMSWGLDHRPTLLLLPFLGIITDMGPCWDRQRSLPSLGSRGSSPPSSLERVVFSKCPHISHLNRS